jgi:PIN domain nuclease of toxin-antitoxin system
MRLLLDTHAILWMVSGDPRLPERARQIMEEAEQLVFSTVSFWETGIKNSLDHVDFQLGENWAPRIEEELRHNGAIHLPIEIRHCARVALLPWHHRDPFDRLLIAQAITENLAILTRDRRFPLYAPQLQVVW